MGKKIRRPCCQPCKAGDGVSVPATYLAAQSSNAGKTVHWVRICDDHRDGWNDGGDWEAPIYPLGHPEF